MAKIEAWLSCDLKKPVQVQGLSGNVFSMDNNGSRINVRIYDNGEKTTVSGSVTANCILADGSTINVNGSLTTDNGQSVAYVDIPQSCLLVPGPIRIAIKLTASGVITTLAAVVTTVYRTQTDIVITPSAQIITDWNAEISAAIATQNAAIANQDTKINDLKSALNVLYNAEGGQSPVVIPCSIYKNKSIDATNGNETPAGSDSTVYTCTDYINVSVFAYIEYKRIKSTGSTDTGIAFFDKDKTYISGQKALNNQSARGYADEIIVVPQNACYVRFSMLKDTIDYGDFSANGTKNDVGKEIKETVLRAKHPADNIVSELIYTQGGYYGADNQFHSNSNWGYTDLIPCTEGKIYSTNISNNSYISFYDSNFEHLQTEGGNCKVAPNGASYIRISATIAQQKQAFLTENSLYKNMVELSKNENGRTYIAKNVLMGTSTSLVDTGYTWDFAQPIYIEFENVGNNGQYVSFGITKDGVLVQAFDNKTVPGRGSYTHKLFSINTNGVHGWITGNHYFTEYTWGISVQNHAGVDYLTYSIYTLDSENPIHKEYPYSNTVLVSTDGSNGSFKDISDAIAYAKSKFTVSTTPVTIFIKKGTYVLSTTDDRNGVINKGANRISIIGENRDETIIVLNNTPAHNNKIIEHGGPSIIANLTMKNLWTEDGSVISYSHNAYCIHNDIAFATSSKYRTVVKNCNLYSEAFAPIGAGLHNLQEQVYEDCFIVFDCKDERAHGYNQWAPIYIHTPNIEGENGCSVVINGCTCIAKSGTKAIALPFNASVSGGITYADIPVSIRRTIGYTTGDTVTDVNGSYDIQPDSELNNVDAWNYSHYQS